MADLIDITRAKENPTIAEMTDARISRLIALQSEWLYNYIVLPVYADLSDVPEVIQEAVVRSMVWSDASKDKSADFQKESIGDYSYDKGKGEGESGSSVTIPSFVKELLIGYKLRYTAPGIPVIPEIEYTNFSASTNTIIIT